MEALACPGVDASKMLYPVEPPRIFADVIAETRK